MDAHVYHQHQQAYEQGLLAVMPDPETGWDELVLPLWELPTSGLRTDVIKNATRAAENTGMPQRVHTVYEEHGVKLSRFELIEPNYQIRAALLGRTMVIPGWRPKPYAPEVEPAPEPDTGSDG